MRESAETVESDTMARGVSSSKTAAAGYDTRPMSTQRQTFVFEKLTSPAFPRETFPFPADTARRSAEYTLDTCQMSLGVTEERLDRT